MSKLKFVAIVVSIFFFCPLIANAQESCDVEVPLYAGQSILVGDVIVSYTSGGEGPVLKVTYIMSDGWKLTETHVAVSLISDGYDLFDKMITKSGNPIPGRFPWKEEYAIALEEVVWDIPATGFTNSINIATHAVVTNSDGEIETAWADGFNFDGRNWATYFEYMLDDCSSSGEPPTGEEEPPTGEEEPPTGEEEPPTGEEEPPTGEEEPPTGEELPS